LALIATVLAIGIRHFALVISPGFWVKLKTNCDWSARAGITPCSLFTMIAKLPFVRRHLWCTALLACIFAAGSAHATQVATPTFSPGAAIYPSVQSVTISSTTGGASFAYTTDGTTPTESGGTVTHGTLYSGTALMIGTTTTIKAIGFKTGMADSAVSTGVYTINIIVLPNSNSGSGGALDTWFLGALAALGVLRWRRKRR
jgi:hypothetical protein